jgi:hypothetical protein
MTTRTAKYLAVVPVLYVALAGAQAAPPVSPFEPLQPDVSISTEERSRLDAGETVVRVTPGHDGYLSLTAVVRVNAGSDRLIAWASNVELLQKGKYVPEIGRFSAIPAVADLDGLAIAEADLDALGRCRPGKCGVKLSADEIVALDGYRTRPELDMAYRQLLVQRARAYLARGDICMLPYHDHREPVATVPLFHTLVARMEFFPRRLGRLSKFLRDFPAPADEHVGETFLYWSKETLGMKPIISITHFSAARFNGPGMPTAVVVAKQVYASHYKNASITVSALVSDGSANYLVYLNRSHVDAFQGVFGGMVRRVVERRVQAEAPGVLFGLRKRLESGDPPSGTKVAH